MNYFEENSTNSLDQTWAFINCEVADHVMTLTLNRPAKKNALHPQMVNEIAFALSHAHHNKDIRAILLKAEGDVFCSGADLKAFMGVSEEFESTIPSTTKQVLMGEIFQEVHKPIICQLHANIMAGGLFFLTGSHFVIADQKVTLGLPEVKRGLFPFQVMDSLLRVMPERIVMDWCVKGKTLDAEYCHKFNLIQKIVNNNIDESVSEWLNKIIRMSPNAVKSGLKIYDELYIDDEKIQKLNVELRKLKDSDDFLEGIKAFNEKRNPEWK